MTRELTLAELSDFTNAKIGDKVYTLHGDKGTITGILPFEKFRIEAFMNNNKERIFDEDGYEYTSHNFPTFFNRPVKIVAADTEDGK